MMKTTIAPFRLDGSRPMMTLDVVFTTSAQDFDEVTNRAMCLLEEGDDGALITFGDGFRWVLIFDLDLGWQMDPLDPEPRNFLAPEVH